MPKQPADDGAKPPKSNHQKPMTRIIFSTKDSLNRRGIRARATSWGWCWVVTGDQVNALYVSMGTPESLRRALLKKGNDTHHQRCPQCNYSESSLIGTSPDFCPACKGDDTALLGLTLLKQGVNLGWRCPEVMDRWELLSLSEKAAFIPDHRLNRLAKEYPGPNGSGR